MSCLYHNTTKDNQSTEQKLKPYQNKQTNIRRNGKRVTELGDEEQKHDNRRDESDNATGERTAVEIIVDFRVRVQAPKLIDKTVHCSSI